MRAASLAALMALGLGGCQTVLPAEANPAVLTHAGADTISVLEAAISEALGGRQVALPSSAFTQDSRYIVEQRPMAGGVETYPQPKPDWFKLYSFEGKCFLLHEQTSEVFELTGVQCRREDS